MAGLFVGRPDFALLLTPEESPEQKAAWEQYRPRLETFLRTHVDPDEIERTAKIPDSVLKGLFALGAFGMKIPEEYGGLDSPIRTTDVPSCSWQAGATFLL